MARRLGPRYDVPQGYAIGDALVQLSQLLRQGVGDYQRQETIDEESRRRDDDYRLRLQQFLGQEEDRKDARAGRAFDQDLSLAKFLHLTKAKDAEPFTLGPGQRRFDPTGSIVAEVPEIVKPEKPQPFTLGPGQRRFDPAGSVVAEVPPEPPKPEKPERLSRDLADALKAEGIDPDTATAAQIKAARATLQNEKVDVAAKGAGANAEAGAAARLPYEVYERRLKEYEAIDQTTAQAATTLQQLTELSKKVSVPDASSRFMGALGREFGSRTQSDTTLTLFDTKAGQLAPLIRAMGDKGNLSDGDIKRGLSLIPDKHDTDAVKAAKLADLREWFEGARNAAAKRLRSPAGSPSNPAVPAPTAAPTVTAPPGFTPRSR